MHQARMQARSSSLGRSYSQVLAAEESWQSLPPGKHLLKHLHLMFCINHSACYPAPYRSARLSRWSLFPPAKQGCFQDLKQHCVKHAHPCMQARTIDTLPQRQSAAILAATEQQCHASLLARQRHVFEPYMMKILPKRAVMGTLTLLFPLPAVQGRG